MNMLNLPLTFLHQPAADPVTSPWLVVLMHGVGSNVQDLFGLAGYVPPSFHVLSLQAPYELGHEAYAWFEFSVDAQGQRHIDSAQEAHSRAVVTQTIARAAEQLGVPPERVIVGGFSQGGIMALSVLLTQPQVLAGALVWHSRLLPEAVAAQVAAPQLQGKTLWLSHGTQDNVIALSSAHAIRDHVQATTPVALHYAEYPCTHTIAPQELHDSMQWLQAQTAAPLIAR